MNVFCIIVAFLSISELVLLQKTGNPDSLIDEMKRNMTVLMSTVDRMQSQLTIMDLQNKLQERINREQVLNNSILQSELRHMELQNKLLNQTVELQQINVSRLAQKESKLNDQEKELYLLRSNLNRSDEIQKFQHSEITRLQTELEDLKLFKETQLNQTLDMSSQQALLEHLIGELNGSKLSSPDEEAAKQLIAPLQEQVNKTIGAYNIILNDVVNQMNTYRIEIERNMYNFSHDIRNIENQFHYVSLSTLGAVKQVTVLNSSLSTRLQKLENQQLDMNSSTTASMSGIRLQLHYLNTSLPARVDNLENELLGLNSSTFVSMSDIKQQLHYLNTSQPKRLNKLENQLLGLNSSTVMSLLGIQHQIQQLNSTTLHSDLDIGNIRKMLGVLNSSMQEEIRDIAFTVSLNRNPSPYHNQIVKYDKVITNIGNGYSTQTGVFTCPRGGVYVFTWSTMSGNSDYYCYAFIYRNGDRLLETYSNEASGGYNEAASNTAVLSLTVGDRVWIKTLTCGYFSGYPYTAFSGWKL